MLFLYRRHLNEFEYLSYLASTVIDTDDSVLTEVVCRTQQPYSGIALGVRITTDFMELFVQANGLDTDEMSLLCFEPHETNVIIKATPTGNKRSQLWTIDDLIAHLKYGIGT